MPRATLDGRPHSPPLPAPIRRVLGRVRRRLRAAAFLRGIGVFTLAGTVGALLGMGADLAAPLPQAMRWLIWGVWLATVATALVLAILRPLLRRVAALDLAAVAERTHPQLGERLTGAVALVCPQRATPVQGAPALIAALADEAAKMVATVDPARAVPWRRPVRWCALGLLVLGLAAAPAAVWPATYGTLAHRFFAPWSDLERIGRFVITVAPGDDIAALGSDLTITARLRPRFGNHAAPDSAWLEWTEAGDHNAWHRVAMPIEQSGSHAVGTSSFAVTLPRLAGSLIYRVGSGSALSRSYRITAIEPPAITALTATVEPPAYTGLAAAKVAKANRIDAWESSRVTLHITASRLVKMITVEWPRPAADEADRRKANSPVAAALAADGRSGTVTATAEASGPFAVTLRDAHGLSSRPEAEGAHQVVVRFDAAPIVALAGPGAAHESSPTDVLALQVAARDDVAVASVELHYTIERTGGASAAGPETTTTKGHVAVPLPGLGTRSARGEARLELERLELEPGDTLTYRVRVADNRPGPRGPNVAWSPEHSLAIAARAEPLWATQQKAERERLQAELDAIRQDAVANRRETEQLRYAADAAQRGNGRWEPDQQQALERRESEARGVSDRLQLLARALADQSDPGLRELARPTRQVAEVEAESSRAMLDQARHTTEATKRLDDLRQADHRLAALEQRLDDLLRRFAALARRDADREHLRDLAGREDAIAARAGAQAPVEQLQREQAAVGKDLDALLKTSPALRGDVLATHADEADALARQAHALAERQNDLARRSGDLADPAQAAELAKLAEAQRTLEEDARRLALDVDPSLAASGRGRLKTDAVHDAVAPLERGDVDEAPQRLSAAESELHRVARDLKNAPTATNADQLARRQHEVRERLQALVAGPIAPQRALRDQAVALGRALADLRDHTRPLSPRARGPAKEAARTVGEQAPRAMDRGTDRLAQGQAAAARDAQRQAAALIERGAQQAEDLAAALRADGPPSGSDARSQPQPSTLAAARAAMRQAAERLAGNPRGNGKASAAQPALQRAARALRAAAERGASATAAASNRPGAAAPGASEESTNGDPQETLAGTGTPDLSALQATLARQTGHTWGELPGHLRTEILQRTQGRYRDDYARLIQLYFRELAAGAGSGRPQP
jgi:hypothetical protein